MMLHALVGIVLAGTMNYGLESGVRGLESGDRPRVPAGWAHADSADGLWREAKDAFSDARYERAQELFRRIHERYPRSVYAADSYYWEAAAIFYAQGSSTRELRRAVSLIDTLTERGPKAQTVSSGQARTLATRIRGVLARNGDADAAAAIATTATTATVAVTASASGQHTSTVTHTSSPSDVAARAGTVASAQGDVAARAGTVAATAGDAAARAGAIAARAGDIAAGGGSGQVPAGCKREEDDERVEALNALLQMNSDDAMPILKKVLARRDQCSELLRRKAVWLVSQKRSEEAADILVETAKNDPDRETRSQAVFWLSNVASERAVDLLDQILKTSKDETLQEQAIFALHNRSRGRAQQILRDYVAREDAPRSQRANAIFWLGQVRSTENAKFLRDLFDKTHDGELREKIMFSLSQMRGVGNEEWLLDLAVSDRVPVDVRKQALWSAGQAGATVAQLGAIYDKGDRELKESVIFALTQKGRDAAALDRLMAIARNEKDKELRKNAIFWLGQSRDPRVVKFLMELIEK